MPGYPWPKPWDVPHVGKCSPTRYSVAAPPPGARYGLGGPMHPRYPLRWQRVSQRGATGAFGRSVAATPLLRTQNCGMSRDRGVATPWSATGGGCSVCPTKDVPHQALWLAPFSVALDRAWLGSECTKIVRFSAVAAATFTALPQDRAIFNASRCEISLRSQIASERRFSLRSKRTKLTPSIHLLMGPFRGAVFCNGGGARKQPIKQPTENSNQHRGLHGPLPLLNGPFSDLNGAFPQFSS